MCQLTIVGKIYCSLTPCITVLGLVHVPPRKNSIQLLVVWQLGTCLQYQVAVQLTVHYYSYLKVPVLVPISSVGYTRWLSLHRFLWFFISFHYTYIQFTLVILYTFRQSFLKDIFHVRHSDWQPQNVCQSGPLFASPLYSFYSKIPNFVSDFGLTW